MSFLSHVSVKSIVGYLVAFFVLICRAFGVDLLPYAGDMSTAVANFANAAAALVPLAFAVWGHIQLAQKHAALVGTAKTVPSNSGATRTGLLLACAFGAVLICSLIAAAAMLTACSTTGTPSPALTQAESFAWSVANALQTQNTATGQPLDQTLATQALTAAGLTGPKTTAYTAIASTLVNAAIQAGAAAKSAGASGTTIQANQSAVLSDPSVIETAAAVAAPTVQPAPANP